MTWTKLSDDMPERRAIWGLSDGAWRLHVTALIYTNRMLAEQLVPANRVGSLVPRFKPALVDELVAAGAWQQEDDDYRIVDSAEDQLAVADVLALREKRAAAGRRGGLASARRRGHELPNGVALAEPNAQALAEAKRNPGPSRPEGQRERRIRILPGEERLPQTPTRPTRDEDDPLASALRQRARPFDVADGVLEVARATVSRGFDQELVIQEVGLRLHKGGPHGSEEAVREALGQWELQHAVVPAGEDPSGAA